ncbi:MAG TPA: thioredoxin family protein [Anaerolineales bacterium]|nr:thioredoxin family protein [Anaerolineales bacterium]
MLRFGYILSLLAILSLACGVISTTVVQTATPIPQAPAQPPTFIPANPEESPTQQVEQLPVLPNAALVDIYDPARNPAEDLKQAILFAQQQNKRIMLELGGDWCIWCTWMDEFYATHQDILQYRADHYILVKVNVSDENMNEKFLSQFPAAAGYPHIYILESDGTFLHSQDTVDLEDGRESYVPEVFMAFLQKWALPK